MSNRRHLGQALRAEHQYQYSAGIEPSPPWQVCGVTLLALTRPQFDMLVGTGKKAQQVADALGLPASSYAQGGFRGSQAISIQPQPGKLATADESTIAKVEQGAYTGQGQLKQLVVPNLKDFTPPALIPGGIIRPVRGR